MPIDGRALRRAVTVLPLLAGVAASMTWAAAASPYRIESSGTGYRLDGSSAYRLNAEAATAPITATATPDSRSSTVTAELAAMPFAREVEAAARESSLDAALVHAVIHVESRHRHRAVSPKGAIGLMQVMPETAARYGIANVGRSPRVNLRAGTLYLRDLMDLFDDRLDLVLAAYNAGEGAVMRHAMKIPPYRETRQYVQDVLEKYRSWRDYPAPAPAPDGAAEGRTAAPAKEYLRGTRLNR